jgi:valyl-tRNA synthetase
MKRFHARVAVIQALKDAGFYIETKDNPMQVPICRYGLMEIYFLPIVIELHLVNQVISSSRS